MSKTLACQGGFCGGCKGRFPDCMDLPESEMVCSCACHVEFVMTALRPQFEKAGIVADLGPALTDRQKIDAIKALDHDLRLKHAPNLYRNRIKEILGDEERKT